MSTINPQIPPETSSSHPRRAGHEKDAESSGRCRRIPEFITRNACLNCKKARAKCDGKTPCRRCTTRTYSLECLYVMHVRHAKGELVQQIKQLEAKVYLTNQIFQALSADKKVPEILDRLRNRETYESIAEWLGRMHLEGCATSSPRDARHSAFDASDHEIGDFNTDNFRWTSVTANPTVLDHLLQLYFAWVHPVHTLFSECHFVESYRRPVGRYCSPVLVNALCAMACHLHVAAEADEIDFAQLGEEFSNAVRASIDPDDTSVTTIQAFAVMFLVDTARGHGLRASSYLKIAAGGISRAAYYEVEGFREVWGSTVRGIRNLNVEWAQMTFQVPPTVNAPPFDSSDGTEDKLDEAQWYYYRFLNDQCPAWQSLLGTTNREKSKLINIIQDATTATYTQQGPRLSAHQVLQFYGRFTTWRDGLPSEIGNIESSNRHALPHVLSLLILYSNSVIQLLRPLLNLEGFRSSLVKDIIRNHAQEGLSLLDEHYQAQYTCRYLPVLQMFSVLHLADVIARFFPGSVEAGGGKDGPEAIQFGMEVLNVSGAGFPVAGPLQEMLRRTAKECSIRLPRNLNELIVAPIPPKTAYRMDDLINACTRPTYVQPVEETRLRYLPSFSADWVANSSAFGSEASGSGRGSYRRLRIPSAEVIGTQSFMQIRNLLNTN